MKQPQHYYVASLKIGGFGVIHFSADTKRQALVLARRQEISLDFPAATKTTVQKHLYEPTSMENKA